MSRKPKHRNPIGDAEDVLAGRRAPDAGMLLELIHAINPSGRDVDHHDRAQRYDLKARLQSLLVRSFPDELTVTTNAVGVVAIAHRYLGRDACHAQLDTLDVDARSWIQWKLDTADHEEPHRSVARESHQQSGPLERGRLALAEYDYEAARAAFEEALEVSLHDLAAARALLGLLVELLAQDSDALALAERLPTTTLADHEVRSLLAIAAARAGDERRARRWLADVGGPRATEAWIVLARAALARDAFEDVDRAVREAQACDPSNPASVEIRDSLAERRRQLRAPDEAELEYLAATAEDASVRLRAREVLLRWPDSIVATRILHAIELRDRRREAHELVVAAEAALPGDPVRARQFVDRAIALGGDIPESLLERITRDEAALRQARHDAAVDQVLALLDTETGYAEYLSLEPALRERVRARDPRPALGWLESLGRAKSPIAVVRALERAIALEHSDPTQASRILDELDLDLRDARRLRERLRDSHRARQLQVFSNARASWASHDADGTARHLAELDVHALDLESRTLAIELGRDVQSHRHRTQQLHRIDTFVADGRLLDARRELEGSQIDESRLLEVRAAIRADWSVRRDSPRPLDFYLLGAALGPIPYSSESERWVAQTGEIVLSAVRDRFVIVAVIDLAGARMELHTVTTPEPLAPVTCAVVDREHLWIAGLTRLLQLDWRSGEPLRWESFEDFVLPEHTVERVFILPRESMLWLESMQKASDPKVQVIDLVALRVLRTPEIDAFLYEIPGEPTTVAAFDHYAGATLLDERARRVDDLGQLAHHRVSAIVHHPGQHGLIAAISEDVDDETPSSITLLELVGGQPRRSLPLPDFDPDRVLKLVASRSDQLVFVHYRDASNATLVAVRTADMTIAYQIPAPADFTLFHDNTCEHAYAIWEGSEAQILRLGPTPPTLDVRPAHEPLPSFEYPFYCSYNTPAALEPAVHAVRDAQWERARDLFSAFSPDQIEEAHRAHFHHLHGLALARTGDLDGAVRAWTVGRSLPHVEGRLFECNFDGCLAILAPLPEPLPSSWWDETTSVLRQLRGAIATADACRARGDDAGALAALRRRVVHRSRELQSLARLAHLMLTTAQPVDPVEQRCVLIALLESWATRFNNLPLVSAWSETRIEDVVEAARGRLGLLAPHGGK